MKILIIEDEIELQKSIKQYLAREKHTTDMALDYMTALEKINLYGYDCILVDLNLPGGSGCDLIKKIKTINSETGILVISARESVEDRVKCLEMGADDYLVKPFHLSELNARLNSIIRRIKFKGEEIISFNEITINPKERTIKIHQKRIDFTRKEFEVMLYLITNKERVITKESLGEHLWGNFMDTNYSYDLVYTHIKNLRKKLTENHCDDYIKNVYGVGYKFTES